MEPEPKTICADCGGELESGWIVEREGRFSFPEITGWYPGPPEYKKHFGLIPSGEIKLDKGRTLAVNAFRCVQCGLLRLYAFSKPEAQ